jgi:hypothetical protein
VDEKEQEQMLREQQELSADVSAVETREDFERVYAKWVDRVRPPMRLESLLTHASARGWI